MFVYLQFECQIAFNKTIGVRNMSRPRFSKEYKTYGAWLKALPRDSRYAKEIIRKHQYFPDKSLSQLRKLQ